MDGPRIALNGDGTVLVGCAGGCTPYFWINWVSKRLIELTRKGQGKAKKGDGECLLYGDIGKGPSQGLKLELHSDGDYADSPNSIIIEKGESERMKGSDMDLSLLTETGNEAWLRRGRGAVVRIHLQVGWRT